MTYNLLNDLVRVGDTEALKIMHLPVSKKPNVVDLDMTKKITVKDGFGRKVTVMI